MATTYHARPTFEKVIVFIIPVGHLGAGEIGYGFQSSPSAGAEESLSKTDSPGSKCGEIAEILSDWAPLKARARKRPCFYTLPTSSTVPPQIDL